MKGTHIIMSIALIIPSLSAYADGETEMHASNMVSETSGFDSVTFTDNANKGTASAVAGLRKYRSQDQFETTMKKYYPTGYEVLVGLSASDRVAIYEQYRRGDRMSHVRIAVFQAAAIKEY